MERGLDSGSSVTLDIAVNESRKQMADRVARSLARLCSRHRTVFAIDTLSTIFLLFFALRPSHIFSLSRYVSLLRLASSVQPSSAHLQQVRVFLSFVF